MNSKELKSRLSDNDMIKIIKSLGEEIYYENEEYFSTSTCLCHGGDSPNKLYYYKDSGNFHCKTHCGSTDIFAIISSSKDITFPESINYVCNLLDINTIHEGFTNGLEEDEDDDWSFINSFNKKYKKLNKKDKESIPMNKGLLNMFQPIYTTEWISDGISVDVMKNFNILYSTLKQSIIIPHFDICNNLIGIRQRALIDDDVAVYGKYSPYSICGDMYNHPLSTNMYGINVNKEVIKRVKKVLIVESEKGVLQVASMFGCDNNFTLALCGCAKLSNGQISTLLELGVQEVILGFDRQYENVNDEKYKKWQKHIKEKFINKLTPYFNVSVLWDTEGLLGYKDSPTDKGRDVLLQLMKNKILIEE